MEHFASLSWSLLWAFIATTLHFVSNARMIGDTIKSKKAQGEPKDSLKPLIDQLLQLKVCLKKFEDSAFDRSSLDSLLTKR